MNIAFRSIVRHVVIVISVLVMIGMLALQK